MLSEFTTPTLSTVDQFGEQMGSKATLMLLDQLKSQKLGNADTVQLKTQLLIRASSSKG